MNKYHMISYVAGLRLTQLPICPIFCRALQSTMAPITIWDPDNYSVLKTARVFQSAPSTSDRRQLGGVRRCPRWHSVTSCQLCCDLELVNYLPQTNDLLLVPARWIEQLINIQHIQWIIFNSKDISVHYHLSRRPGASKGTPGDAKCVTEILGLYLKML